MGRGVGGGGGEITNLKCSGALYYSFFKKNFPLGETILSDPNLPGKRKYFSFL